MDPRILFYASDLTETYVASIIEFTKKQLGPRSEPGQSKLKHLHKRSKGPAATTVAPVGNASVVSGGASTSVVSEANAPRIATSEAGSLTGQLVS